MRTFPLALLSTLLLAACDAAGPGNDGPLALGIIAGNHQVAEAGAERLPQPVVGKMVRQPGGGITFRLVSPAYAQGTVVNGSPVPGAVVCAVSVVGELHPFTPCTNTDDQGRATFFFTLGTVAGEARAEIRGTVENEPAVFDTVVAVVVPGAIDRIGVQTDKYYYFRPGDTIDIRDYVAGGSDAYGNDISPDSVAEFIAELSPDNVLWSWEGEDTPISERGTGWLTTLPDSAGVQHHVFEYYPGHPECDANPDGSPASEYCRTRFTGSRYQFELTSWLGNTQPRVMRLDVLFPDPADPKPF